MMKFVLLTFVLTLAIFMARINAFSGISTSVAKTRKNSGGLNFAVNDGIDAISSLPISLLQKVGADQARSEFFFFFFGGSGALGIGVVQIPKLIDEYKALQALAGGVSKGGENMGILPLATIGYPESLKTADIEDIINTIPSVETISQKGPKKSYLAQRGFLEREGFYASMLGKNPLALYAAYDAMAKGGGDLTTPQEAEAVIAQWKSGGIDAFKQSLLVATIRKYSAFAVFFALIGLVLDLIIESGVNAFLQ